MSTSVVQYRESRVTSRFWPFDHRYAWLASAILLPVSIALAAWLNASDALPGNGMPWWILLGAVLIGLLPVILLVLGSVSAVKAAGVEVTFAAVRRAVRAADEATVRATLSDNLGAPPGTVLDTSGDTIIQALQAAVNNDVVVVSLGDGDEWWETRLLLLVAGATRLGHPQAVAFTATRGEKAGQYLGWATPADLLRTHLSSRVQWREPYRLARRAALLVALSARDSNSGRLGLPWPAAGKQETYGNVPANLADLAEAKNGSSVLPWPNPDVLSPPMSHPDRGPDDPYLPERFLLDQLRQLENPGEHGNYEQLRVNAAWVEDLFDPVLR